MILSYLQWNNMNLNLKFLHILIKTFQTFILKFTIKKNYFPYLKQLKIIIIGIRNTFILSFMHLAFFSPYLALWLSEDPIKILYLFNFSIKQVITKLETKNVISDFFYKIVLYGFPLLEKIYFFKIYHINLLVKTKGTVTKIKNLKFINKYILDHKNIYLLKPKINLLNFFNNTTLNHIQIFDSKQSIYLADNKKLINNTYFSSNIKVFIENYFQDMFKTGEQITVTGIYRIELNLFSNKKDFKLPFVIYSNSIFNILSKKYDLFKILNVLQKTNFIVLSKKFSIILLNSIVPELFFIKYIKKFLLCFLFNPNLKHRKKKLEILKPLKFLIIGGKNSGKSQILYFMNAIIDTSTYINIKNLSNGLYNTKNKVTSIVKLNKLFLKNTLLIDNLNESTLDLSISENDAYLNMDFLYYKTNEYLTNSQKLIASILLLKQKKILRSNNRITQLTFNRVDFCLPLHKPNLRSSFNIMSMFKLNNFPYLEKIKNNFKITVSDIHRQKNTQLSLFFITQIINFMKYKSIPFLTKSSFSLIIKFFKILRSILLKTLQKHLSHKILEIIIIFSISTALLSFRKFVMIQNIFFSIKLIIQLILLENKKKLRLLNQIIILFPTYKKKKITKLSIEELTMQFIKLLNYNSLLGKTIIKIKKTR